MLNMRSITVMLLAATVAAEWTPITVIEDGQERTLYLATQDKYSHDLDADTEGVEISMWKRTYLSIDSEMPAEGPPNFFKPKMLGGYVEWTVDLSNVGCGCITAFSTRVAPVVDEQGNPDPSSDGLYFCGAQHKRALCPEWDFMEANAWSFRSTAHACDEPNEFGYFDSCDHGGTGQTDVQWDHADEFGPGEQYAINTDYPFRVRQDFTEGKWGEFVSYTTYITQGDHTIEMSMRDDYFNNFTQYFDEGMVWVLGMWAPDNVSWLTHDRCEQRCDGDPAAIYSDFVFSTTGAVKVDCPALEEGNYVWGNECQYRRAGECGPGTSDCYYSWPVGDELKGASDCARCRPKEIDYKYGNQCTETREPNFCDDACDGSCHWSFLPGTQWNDDSAACRCLPEQLDPSAYTYGDRECGPNEGTCDDSCDCRASWPINDPQEWLSKDTMCRCKPETEFSFGSPCDENDDIPNLCGGPYCDNCNKSWEYGDPLGWKSEDKACRCLPKQLRICEYTYSSDQCGSTNAGICGDNCSDCRWSWPSTDPRGAASADAMCRCWWW